MPEPTARPRPRRRWLRVSPQGLMASIALVAVGMGYLIHLARVQREAVLGIQRSGGSVLYELPAASSGLLVAKGASKQHPSRPRWLEGWLGPDYWEHVRAAGFDRTATDADLALAGRLRGLESLAARNNSNLTDAVVSHLAGLTDLNDVNLSFDPQVTGAALAYLKDARHLQVLQVAGTGIRGADLAWVALHAGLKQLDLSGTAITEAGLIHLAGLTRLEQLRLTGTAITSAGLRHLPNLPKLTILRWTKPRPPTSPRWRVRSDLNTCCGPTARSPTLAWPRSGRWRA